MKKTIEDYTYDNKKVIIRCDLNVPIEKGKITDETRIKESLTSINYLINHNAKVIVMSHLGKITNQEDKKDNTLYPVYMKLKEYLDTNVYFSSETRGKELETLVNNLKPREVLLMENTRFEDYPNKLESSCDKELSEYWAGLGDIFINDAYGTSHRKHASNYGIANILPSGIGFLIEKEITKIDEILNETTHPFTVIMGGKKIDDKTLVIDNLIKKCDYLLLGGGMCFTFLKSLGYNVGSSITSDENIEYCKKLLDDYPNKIILPKDIVTDKYRIKKVEELIENDIGYDIGPETEKVFNDIIKKSKRIIINGPMGLFEDAHFQNGTISIYKTIKENNIKTIIGGGDTAASANLLGYSNTFYHISTGGGATLNYLGGEKLPAIDIISNKYN